LNFGFRRVNFDRLSFFLWLHTDRDPDPRDWKESCEAVRRAIGERGGDLSRVRVFVVSDGGAPNVLQRRQIIDALSGRSIRAAIVTSVLETNPLKRGIATALSWTLPDMKFFAPRQVANALEHVDIDRDRFSVLWKAFDEMRGELPPTMTLPIVARHLDLDRDSSFSQSGDRYGPYEVVRLLGSGGMANVFEARHVDLGTLVALKVLHGVRAGDESSIRRTIEEGRACTAVRHPNVVEVLDVGRSGHVAYLAMELLRGETLATWHGKRPLVSLEDALDVVFPILSGMCAVHSAGFVHRDIKPSNVFLARRSGSVDPVIIDFGVAKFVDPVAAGPSSVGVGTPQYMAPEQARGQRATPKSDQYSLGLVLYELVTGAAPFSMSDRYDLLHAIVTSSIPSPSSFDVGLPRSFDAVVLRAMARAPEDRFHDVRAFGAALLEFASEETRRRWKTEFAPRGGS
jgi:hypothetical protein